MKTAIIIHWMPDEDQFFNPINESSSNNHWLPRLQKQLLINGIFTQAPEMPTPYLPNYDLWKKEFERFDINENTILVWHSCGAGFIIRWLSENNIKVNKVALVAPWLNLDNEENINFFDFKLNKDFISRAKDLLVFSSKTDMDCIVKTVNYLKNEIEEIKIKEFEDMWHFCFEDMWTKEFPELLDYLLS